VVCEELALCTSNGQEAAKKRPRNGKILIVLTPRETRIKVQWNQTDNAWHMASKLSTPLRIMVGTNASESQSIAEVRGENER
jgi:hypothetical protein